MIRLSLSAVAVLLLVSSTSRAADPLDCIPGSAQAIIVSDNPRKLAEAVTGLEAFKNAQKLPQYAAIYDSTTARRAFQILALFEKELGAKWPELLDQLGGNGVAIGLQFGTDPAPTILVLQGKDEKQVAKAVDLATKVIDEELARQGSKDRVQWSDIAGHKVAKFGDTHLARVGATVLVSNNETMLKAAVILAATQGDKPVLHKARKDAFKSLPKDPLAWLWIDFASVKQSQSAKDFFDATRKDFLQTLVVGGTIDCLRRADYVAAGLYKEPTGFRLSLRIPAGRSEFPPEFQLHVPPKGEPGALPLLEPPGTIYSQSFHLDIGYMWKHRDKLLNDEIRGGLEQADKELAKVLPAGVKLGDLLEMWGPYHRVVVANHDKMPYKKEPGQRFPAFGYVASMRDAKFAKSLAPTLRAAGVLASFQLGLKLTEHKHEGIDIVAYRFPEDKELADDPDGIRFNFEPCFATVGDYFVVASTVELCKKLITELKRVEKEPAHKAVIRGKFFARGGAELLAALPEPLITDAILSRGIGLDEARKEVAALVSWIKSLGAVGVELDIAEKEYKLDLVWELAK
ncbi:MAG: hypothetical protein L0241_05515 [Planctomycetia bacterium]|nr:hypothetical protein [Planctomycetia bacterium]